TTVSKDEGGRMKDESAAVRALFSLHLSSFHLHPSSFNSRATNMKVSPKIVVRSLCLVLAVALASVVASAQQSATGSLRGQIMDEFGGVIVGATVTAIDPSGKERTATTDNDGNFTIAGLAPGKYTLRAVAPGFALYESADVDVVPGRAAPLKITLGVSLGKEEVTVASEGHINVDANSAGAIV